MTGQDENDDGGALVPSLETLGFDDARRAEVAALNAGDAVPGRVAVRYKGQYAVWTTEGEVVARIKGVLRYRAGTWAELPVVGDWVLLTRKTPNDGWRICDVLERRTALTRKEAGLRMIPQTLVANVTRVVVVMALTEDYNLRRLERYLVMIRESGANPIVVLNKSDALPAEMVEASVDEVRELSGDAPVIAISALEGSGLAPVFDLIERGETIVVVGSSGAGKSTLVNAIIGAERQRTGEVRETDGRGRHTTTRREMIALPCGAILIDTPGIREIQLWDADEAIDDTFADIEELAAGCRFGNCTHGTEPGCNVRRAIDEEELEESRYEGYLRMREELAKLAARQRVGREAPRRIFKDIGGGRRKGRR